ncbi:14433_t:CDS:2, partial [Cetraspora pellucida]
TGTLSFQLLPWELGTFLSQCRFLFLPPMNVSSISTKSFSISLNKETSEICRKRCNINQAVFWIWCKILYYSLKYNDSKTESKDINNSELQQIKSYSQKLSKSELSLSDLESSSNTGSGGKEKEAIQKDIDKELFMGLTI